MHPPMAAHIRRRSSSSIRLESLFSAISILLLLFFVLVGEPQLGVTLAAPWLSVALIHRPALLFAVYIYIPFYKSVVQNYTPIDLTVWLALLAIVTLMVSLVKLKRLQLSFVFFVWMTFAAILIAGTAWSIDIKHSFGIFVTTFALTVLPLLLGIVVANDREQVASFLRVTLLGSVIYSFAGMFSLIFLESQRLELTSNTIGSGRIAMLGLLIAPVVVPAGKKKPFLVTSIVVVSLIASLASGSRGPLLAGVVSLIAVYGIWTKWMAIRILGFVTAAIVGIAILFSAWIEDLIPMSSLLRMRMLVEAVFGQGELDGSSMARVHLMAQAVDMWSDRPFTGWGIGAYGILSAENPQIGINSYPHNLFLHVGAELGMIGFVIVTILVFWVLVRLYSDLKDPLITGITILTVFALVSAQLSNNLYDNRWLWGMLLLGGAIKGLSEYQASPGVEVAE